MEWIYEDAEEVGLYESQSTQNPAQFIPLPSEQTENLRYLAQLGITREILSELDKLEHHDAKYTPFVKTLRQLAKAYQFDQIITLLETTKRKA